MAAPTQRRARRHVLLWCLNRTHCCSSGASPGQCGTARQAASQPGRKHVCQAGHQHPVSAAGRGCRRCHPQTLCGCVQGEHVSVCRALMPVSTAGYATVSPTPPWLTGLLSGHAFDCPGSAHATPRLLHSETGGVTRWVIPSLRRPCWLCPWQLCAPAGCQNARSAASCAVFDTLGSQLGCCLLQVTKSKHQRHCALRRGMWRNMSSPSVGALRCCHCYCCGNEHHWVLLLYGTA